VSPEVQVDFPAVMERMRRLRAGISSHDSAERFKKLGVDVFLGPAKFTSRRTVEVQGKTLRFKKAVIATGARPLVPDIPGLNEAGFLTNETIFSLTERPRHLVVLGAGPIGCEMAQAFRRLGSSVTLITHGSQFLPREDPDAVQILLYQFKKEEIRIRFNTHVIKVESSGVEKKIHLQSHGKDEVLTADQILIGVGRVSNIEGLELETAGVQYHSQGVQVNDYLQTSNPHVFAAGDICLPYKFTHAADAAARIVLQNALFFKSKKFSSLVIPWCTYTDPEVAHTGLYERDALKMGMKIETFKRSLEDVDRAITDGETQGFIKIVTAKGTGKILGATLVARHAGEIISELTTAVTAGIGLGTLSNVIHPYPTQAEVIKQAADAYNRTRLTPKIKKLFELWLRWRRM
jgi:pyruvate/2-oxoglutarate dehydrogenase complex dihydrolipoamide dehydrogenase (E3) component